MEQTEIITFILVASILLVVFTAGIIAFVLQYRKKRVEHENEKTMISVKHKEELLTTQLEMQLQTMQHIGREIHDNVGQKLTLASLYTQQLSFENKAPQINDKIENISSIINESLRELRRLSKSLTDDAIAQKNIVALIQDETNKVQELKQCKVLFTTSHQQITTSYQLKSLVLRVIQEFLQNTVKHAKCKNIHINLNYSNNIIEIKLQDDGVGFDTQKHYNGIGLKNMIKRIHLLNGSYILNSQINNGTQFQLKIPVPNEA